jgi:2,5-dihydroxypyridine 5,6-dioxygenase
MLEMFWKSVGTDSKEMSENGKIIAGQLAAGKEVHITSEAGTDIRFRIDRFPTLINSGRCLENPKSFGPSMAFLPAGEVYTCVDPSSANGKVVVPEMTYNGQEIVNLTLVFKDGRFTEITGEKNVELIQKSLEKATGDYDVLSVVDLGINPDSHPLENSSFYSWEMDGMVTLATGVNVWAGGDVNADMGLTFHLVNSNLSVDGKELVRAGKLITP